MKALILSLFVSFLASSTLAETPELKDSMEAMGTEFKVISKNIRSGEISEADVDSIQKLQAAAADAALVHPEKANTDELKAEYDAYMVDLIELAKNLEAAMQAALANGTPNELDEIIAIFSEMNDLRKKSHKAFKPKKS